MASVMTKRGKEGVGEVIYTSDLGRSTVTESVLRTLVDEGKLDSLAKVRAPESETVPTPWSDEAVIFIAFSMLVSGSRASIWP